MRYPKFRRQHLFVGSGVIEAGCKTVIGSRLKQSGMFWTVRGANASALEMKLGDYSKVANGQQRYDESSGAGDFILQTIKKLAEAQA